MPVKPRVSGEHQILDGRVYSPFKRCIYCGCTSGKLEREHILPFGFGGSAILPEASCRNCAVETGKAEENLLRGAFWPVRVFRNLQSRSKHRDAPKTIEAEITRNGIRKKVEIDVSSAPLLLPFPTFPLPSIITGNASDNMLTTKGHHTILFGPTPEEIAKSMGASDISIFREIRPKSFARVIAKIAYSYACAEGAISKIQGRSPVVPAILGESNDIGMWVGTLQKPIEVRKEQLHRIEIYPDRELGMLLAEVQLFADSETPSYGVVLGRLALERM